MHVFISNLFIIHSWFVRFDLSGNKAVISVVMKVTQLNFVHKQSNVYILLLIVLNRITCCSFGGCQSSGHFGGTPDISKTSKGDLFNEWGYNTINDYITQRLWHIELISFINSYTIIFLCKDYKLLQMSLLLMQKVSLW